ncbi:DNA polymerase [Amycolatopsis lurida NRRL 2430]|uniref:DNA polymerase n=1 Tax=Amycolatopsis lurida NRRL 2430 TaxID=1460371 RepID=A0A2P2FEP6_AMYLU|nr:DNA polymerase [Amycolatopsis lurida NRRL 2430]
MNIGALLDRPLLVRERVLEIQTKLHRWATADRGRRFDDLFNLVADPAFLVMAWTRVRENKGARTAGIDGATAWSIENSGRGVTGFLTELRSSLKDRTFRPTPVRTAQIPKAIGKTRRLGIPTVRDRVVQASLKLVLEPILEADFDTSSYGFRPQRRCQDAIEEIRFYAARGYEQVLEGDIAACFDEISHPALMDRLRGRVGDRRVLALIKAFLKAGLLDELRDFRDTTTGTPQGGILSPLLANLALSVLDEHFRARWEAMGTQTQRWRATRRGAATYRLVRYADDFVVMVFGTRQHAESLYDEIETVLGQVGLRLAPDKTRVTGIDEGFDFLGFRIQRHRQKGSDRRLIYTYPSKKSLAAIRRKVTTATGRQTTSLAANKLFVRLGQITRGWAIYFRHGASSRAFGALNHHLWWRVWRWLRNKHPNRNAKWIIRHYYGPGQWWPTSNGVRLFQPATVSIQRYRFRGTRIPNPWMARKA